MGVFADAGKNVEHFAAGRGGMLHTVGREQGEMMVLRQVDQLAVDPFFAPHEMALEVDVNAAAPKSVEQPLRAVHWLGSARVSRAGDGVPPSRTFRGVRDLGTTPCSRQSSSRWNTATS